MPRQYDNFGRDQINIEENRGTVVVQNLERLSRSRNEKILLRVIKDEVQSRLDSSLHNAVFLNLGKDAQPEQVQRPWAREIKIGAKVATVIPDEMTISQVFEVPEIQGKLLILGQPGSGKTTMLLDLAKTLVEKAEIDPSYPIPLLFNLSGWKDEKQLIRDWIVAELKSKYGVNNQLGQQWIKERVILPLLDGLDEVDSGRQENCVKRINEFLEGEAAPIYAVVCSRISEYENYASLLRLGGAVCLRGLGDEQIENYLTQVDRYDVWKFLNCRAEFLEFVRVPLLLSMVVLAYPKDMTEQWQQLQTANDQRQYLLDSYVERMLHRLLESSAYGKSKLPSSRQTREYLIWLAKQMDQRSQTEFFIEKIQIDYLKTSIQRRLYRLIVAVILGLILGIIFYLLSKVFGKILIDTYFSDIRIRMLPVFESSSLNVALVFKRVSDGMVTALDKSVFWGMLITIILGSFLGIHLGTKKIEFQNSLYLEKFSWKNFIKWLLFSCISGIIFAFLPVRIFYFYVPTIFITHTSKSGDLIRERVFGISNYDTHFWIAFISLFLLWQIIWVSFGIIKGLQNDIQIINPANRGVQIAVKNSAVFSLIYFSGLMAPTFFMLDYLSRQGLSFSKVLVANFVVGALIATIVFGLPSIQHLFLRLFLYLSGVLPWNYARFLDYSTERLFLQRIGGRYRFVHKLLQDHFASMK
jgi:DNA polymerase III delta prime subunit